MAKKSYPDPNDRSVNKPSIIVSQVAIVKIYKSNVNCDDTKSIQEMIDWFLSKAESYHWDTAVQHGNQVLLTVNRPKFIPSN